MFSSETVKPGLKTGIPPLDRIMGIGNGIISLRSNSISFLFHLLSHMIVRNHSPSKKTVYLHWVDYHKRYWTLDFDLISDISKYLNKDLDSVQDSLFFIRAFSKDSTETQNNWEEIRRFCRNINFLILDSVSDLTEKGFRLNKKGRVYSIGMFSKLCSEHKCIGLTVEHSSIPIHPYLGEVSSIILEFLVRESIILSILKHPLEREKTLELRIPPKNNLVGWLA